MSEVEARGSSMRFYKLKDDPRELILKQATALFAEVLKDLCMSIDARMIPKLDEKMANYRRRWKEITGMEVPE